MGNDISRHGKLGDATRPRCSFPWGGAWPLTEAVQQFVRLSTLRAMRAGILTRTAAGSTAVSNDTAGLDIEADLANGQASLIAEPGEETDDTVTSEKLLTSPSDTRIAPALLPLRSRMICVNRARDISPGVPLRRACQLRSDPPTFLPRRDCRSIRFAAKCAR